MKIFAIYTNITLTSKPPWLDSFVLKYNPWGLHVTLKQACSIEDREVSLLKKKVSRFFNEYKSHPIVIACNHVERGNDEHGPILVLAEKNEELMNLQSAICAALSDYSNYVDPDTEAYEKNFRPHITISYGIPANEYRECLKILKDGCTCTGIISEIVLSVLERVTVEQATNPANKTLYKLKNVMTCPKNSATELPPIR